jgi:hypothetical protein
MTYSQYRLEDYKYRVLFDKKELSNAVGSGEEAAGNAEGEEAKVNSNILIPYYFSRFRIFI